MPSTNATPFEKSRVVLLIEFRFAFFEENLDVFETVARGSAVLDQLRLEIHLRLEVVDQTREQQLFGAGGGQACAVCEIGHDRVCLGPQFVVGNHARAVGKRPQILRQAMRADLRVLDDWGLQSSTAEGRQDVLQIIEARNTRKSTIISSQLPVTEWHHRRRNP